MYFTSSAARSTCDRLASEIKLGAVQGVCAQRPTMTIRRSKKAHSGDRGHGQHTIQEKKSPMKSDLISG